MKVLLWMGVSLLFSFSLMASTAGEFCGTVVQGPERADTWVYVEGHDHGIRRVYVAGAQIWYSEKVPAAQRLDPVPRVLPVGTQVRITAAQDAAGEWRATQIEILSVAVPEQQKNTAPPTTSQT